MQLVLNYPCAKCEFCGIAPEMIQWWDKSTSISLRTSATCRYGVIGPQSNTMTSWPWSVTFYLC